MPADRFVPAPEDRFSFGIWTVGWQGVDVFGNAVRPPMPAERAVRKLAELGAYGINYVLDQGYGQLARPTLADGESWRDIRGFTADANELGRQGMAFERLDQLALEHLHGVR